MKRKRDIIEEKEEAVEKESQDRDIKKAKKRHNPPPPEPNFPRRVRPHSNPRKFSLEFVRIHIFSVTDLDHLE